MTDYEDKWKEYRNRAIQALGTAIVITLIGCGKHRSYSVHRAFIGATNKVSFVCSMWTC